MVSPKQTKTIRQNRLVKGGLSKNLNGLYGAQSDLVIRDQSTFDHDGIPSGHNYGLNGCHIYGRALHVSVLLTDASVCGDPAAFN